ncbi:hypothetical protein C3Z09_22175 [Lelliottia aquatilis]|nr:hypothetical protein C3Z09_22175 [Lelliottia aquatilis]
MTTQYVSAYKIKAGDTVKICGQWVTLTEKEKSGSGYIFKFKEIVLTHNACYVEGSERLEVK